MLPFWAPAVKTGSLLLAISAVVAAAAPSYECQGCLGLPLSTVPRAELGT